MPRHWRNALLRTLAWLMACGGVGWVFDALWPALAAGLLLAHAWLCFRMIRLERHIGAGRIDWNDDDDVVERFGARFLRWRRAERSARRRLLRALQAFRDAAAALPDAVLVIDDRERVQWANKAAERLLGIRVPQAAGSPLADLVPSSTVLDWYRDHAAEPLMDVPAPQDPALRLSFRVVAYRETARLLIVREIAWLLRLERMRRDFVANVSHELRTPLTVIAGYLDVIEDDELPEYAGVLGQMRTQAQRMTRIVEDLLLLSRLDALESAPLEPVAMRPMLEQILADARVISDGQHRIALQAREVPDLLGSQPHLLSAFMNLAVNAVRYTPPGGSITVRYGRVADGVRYEVEDTGFGIPAEHIDRITERFYRVSVSRSREKGGTGLAPAWGLRSSSTFCSCMAGGWKSRARSARARVSAACCRSSGCCHRSAEPGNRS
ncbi:MAG: phosphate regulon sensor protein PhoR [Xanthomonadales bacterium]|nr:phosphate regulon sensor protein PhoR [Xanthomonadales bacterium]